MLGMILLFAPLIWRLPERSMRGHLKATGNTINGCNKRRTEHPTSYIATTKFHTALVGKVANAQKLTCPLPFMHKEYIEALDVESEFSTRTKTIKK